MTGADILSGCWERLAHLVAARPWFYFLVLVAAAECAWCAHLLMQKRWARALILAGFVVETGAFLCGRYL